MMVVVVVMVHVWISKKYAIVAILPRWEERVLKVVAVVVVVALRDF
jgi:hypothetical protein